MLSKAQIKNINALRQKKNRQKSGRFIAEGIKVTDELLKENFIQIEEIFALEKWITKYIHLQKTHPHIKIIPVTDDELKHISNLDTAQEVLSLCKIPAPVPIPDLKGKITLMLESVRDPGNVGTIVRIADWFGIEQVICSPDCADVFNPKTIQATMGSLARTKVHEFELGEVLKKNKNVPLYAAVLGGEPITAFAAIQEGIIAIGNEASGLSEQMIQSATHCITIPGKGKAESLNAAIAAGIICGRLLL